MTNLHCEAKACLFLAHEAASAAFENAKARLTAQIETASHAEFDRLALAAERALDEAENARNALNQHIAEHNCLTFESRVLA